MTLPPLLQRTLEQAAEGVSVRDLARAGQLLSERYRGEVRDGAWHVSDDLAARSYLASRFPATYAAASRAMAAVAAVLPDFSPKTMLDVGAGPGTASWAAASVWPSLEQSTLLEGSANMRQWGEKFAANLQLSATWQSVDLRSGLNNTPKAELVIIAYVLNELEEADRKRLLAELWERTEGVFLIVEPGTPAGWQRIVTAREQLLQLNANIAAPCAHAAACPIEAPDWCHFAARLARSRLHRQSKNASLGHEDEPFSYVAFSRQAAALPSARVLAPSSGRSGLVQLKLCTDDGKAEQRTISKREGPLYKRAKNAEWGDGL